MNIQNRDNFFTAGAHAIKKIKIFRSWSTFKTIPQLISTIEIACVVVTIEQQTIFRTVLFEFKFEFKKRFFQVQVRVRQNNRVLSSSGSSSQPCSTLATATW